ncbi:adenosine receptor A2a-like [Mugil cephalus]|uniref:adenosine receptor A2a-like n=1 Tax=Mugil cephalus TaxID=48193 RepID=UPI001FB7027A|nr:adenosine receptor A2a-like [Mugil cephalus]
MADMPSAIQPDLKGVYIATEFIIAMLAITGNFLVCLAVTLNKKLRTITNYFLVSLAVADILVGLVAIPCAVLTDLGKPHHDLPLCLLLLSVLMFLTQSSILSLLAVAAERYMAILLPFQYQRIMSPRTAWLALFVTWVFGAISGSVPLMDWHKKPADSGYCIFTCVVDMRNMVYFNFFCCLLVPLVAMYIIYGHIFLTVRRQLRSAAVEPQLGELKGAKSKVRTRQDLRKAHSLFLVLFLFTVCWMPIHLINCVLLLYPQCGIPMSVILSAVLLSHANSAINPILYAYRMRSFRHTLRGMCRATHSVQPKSQE